MFTIFGGTEARRLPGRFQVPWKEIALAAIILIALAGIAYGGFVVSRGSENTSAPAVPAVSQPVAQSFDTAQGKPAQQVPEAVAPVVPPIQVNWVEIGQARNGNEVLALPIPWDKLVMLPVTPDNKVLWLKIAKLNLPPASDVKGVNPYRGWVGYLLKDDTVILYAFSNYHWSEQDPFVLSYLKAEGKLSEIEGLSP